MTAEEEARQKIDRLLKAAGWDVQDSKKVNLGASFGVAVEELYLPSGPADYTLFLNRKPVGVIEAKPAGTTLSGVEPQTGRYLGAIPEKFVHLQNPPPFQYESTGIETHFVDRRDPDYRSRRVFAFHKPETLSDWLCQESTLRARLRAIPQLSTGQLRECQFEAVTNLETSLAENRPRALLQMTMGSGKTFAAVSLAYRLIKFAKAKRILFLVDRKGLGKQALNEFRQYTTPDDGRKFTELYNVQHLTSNVIDPVSRVCISTIQRLYSILKGESELDVEAEEQSLFELNPVSKKPMEVCYNPQVPIEAFDFIIVDECHRSIYTTWRQVVEYFDAFIIGMTATPSKQTLGFFKSNLVMEYGHNRSVADGINVDYEIYRIKTAITEKGSRVEAGYLVDKRDKLTRKIRWEMLDNDLVYYGNQLDRDIVATNQIQTVVRTFRDKLFTELFPGRTIVPKTLIFAKDDSHAEDIVEIVREEFGKGNEFCRKITYKATDDTPDQLISDLRISFNPRIAVTVDMISTGMDIKPLECLIFMRDVKSRGYFEQMKGRGCRTISSDDFRSVSPDTSNKTHYIIVDAVGVCESDKTDSRPLERKKFISFEQILNSIAIGNWDEDTLSTLASRLARLDKTLDEKDREEIRQTGELRPLKQLIRNLINAVDPDRQEEKAKEMFGTTSPDDMQIKAAAEELGNIACEPFDNPSFRNKLIDIRKLKEQTIDAISQDKIIFAGYDPKSTGWAHEAAERFKKFIEENKNEISALQIIYSKPYGQRHLTFEQIKQLAGAIERPPYNLTQDIIWYAYEQLDRSKVRDAGPQKLLTDIISLVRFAIEESPILQPFTETVNERFLSWLSEQENSGQQFTQEQKEWLQMIKEHIATSLHIEMDDLELAPFYERGGPVKAGRLFGPGLGMMLEELNEVLAG
jgi:type I restriction enzyme, R subunit